MDFESSCGAAHESVRLAMMIVSKHTVSFGLSMEASHTLPASTSGSIRGCCERRLTPAVSVRPSLAAEQAGDDRGGLSTSAVKSRNRTDAPLQELAACTLFRYFCKRA